MGGGVTYEGLERALFSFQVHFAEVGNVALELPAFGELVVVGVELELIRLEVNFVEEGVETLEIHHLIHVVLVLLLDALSDN